MLGEVDMSERSCATEIFCLKIDGRESLVSLRGSLSEFCGRIEAHPGESVGLIEINEGQTTIPWPGDITVQDANHWERAIRRLEQCRAIVVTTVRGECGGATLDFLLASDFRIAAPSFCLRLPVNKGQFWPGMGLYRIVQQIGVIRARQIVLWQPSLTAEGCYSAGLVDELNENLQGAAHNVISRIDGKKGAELAIRKRLILEAESSPYDEALGTHLAACDRELRRIREADLA